jgi:hypothetical protein
MGVLVNTVSGSGHLARAHANMLGNRIGLKTFTRNASTSLGIGSNMTPFIHETRDLVQGISEGDFKKSIENAGWLALYGTPVGGVGSGLGKVGYAHAA